MAGAAIRSFLALSLPQRVRIELAMVQQGLRAGRPVPMENLHLTLVFLGEVPRAALEELHLSLERLAAPRLELRLKGMGAFGRETPRNVWAGVEPNPALDRLQSKLKRAARMAGIEVAARRFVPHVTIARLPGRRSEAEEVAAFVASRTGFATPPFPVDHVTLFSSHLTREGPDYEELARYPSE